MNLYLCLPDMRYRLDIPFGKASLADVCAYYHLPIQSMSFYAKTYNDYNLIIGIHKPIIEFENSTTEILVRPDRNIDYTTLLEKKLAIKKNTDSSSEYTFSDPNANGTLKHIEFNATECQDFVTKKVKEFLTEEVQILPEKKIVLGVSGGGDSNTLLHSFLGSGMVQQDQLLAVMMLGIPDWDLGKDRAIELCKNYGVELQFVTSEEVNRLIGRTSSNDWVSDFEKYYPKADLEVAGTYAIRLSLEFIAEKVGAQSIVTGLNLEDLLSESLFQTMKGQLPLPFPVRRLRKIDLWYPLYQCPKKILDGCYPKYSIQNYIDRYPSKMPGRALAYYTAQMMHVVTPGLEYDMLRGYKKLSESNENFTQYDEDLKLDVLGDISLKGRKKWVDFLNGH